MIKKSTGLFFAASLILAICSCAPTTIDTLPQGAEVYRGETQVGTTPFNSRVWLTEKNFSVRKDRYFNEPVMLNYDSPEDIILKLRAVPVLVYSAPDAEIYPTGSETSIGHTPMKVAVSDKEKTYTLKLKDYYDQDIKLSVDAPNPTIVKMARRPIVTISAEPEGVEVYENGILIGTAPIREEILAPRTFELRKANYFTQTGTLTGAPPYEVHTVLRAFPVITVSATPAGAEISRAGGLIGKDSIKLAVGEKIELEVRADRYYMQNVTLTPESPAQVSVALKAMPYVMINSEPTGAEVLIDGKSIGMTPVEQLIEKDTVIELRKEGFITKTATLTGADNQVAVTLEAMPTPVEPAVQPAVKAPKAASPAAATDAPAKSGINLLLLAGAVVAVIAAGLIFFLLKRKKQE